VTTVVATPAVRATRRRIVVVAIASARIRGRRARIVVVVIGTASPRTTPRQGTRRCDHDDDRQPTANTQRGHDEDDASSRERFSKPHAKQLLRRKRNTPVERRIRV